MIEATTFAEPDTKPSVMRVHSRTEDGRIRVHAPDGAILICRALADAGDRFAVGTEVLVLPAGPTEGFILGYLHPRPAVLRARNGAAAELVERDGKQAFVLRDPRGQTVLEIEAKGQRTVLRVADGDLDLEAPNGNIRLAAGKNLQLVAGEELSSAAPRWRPTHRRCEARLEEASVRGTSLLAHFGRIVLQGSSIETLATRIVERSRDTLRFIENLQQTTAGRIRKLVRGAFSLRAERADINTENDLRMDGRKIHLG